MGWMAWLPPKEKLLELAHQHLNREFIENLKKGATLVPAAFLEQKLREGMADDPTAKIDRVSFSDKGISVRLRLSKAGLEALVSLDLAVGGISLTAKKQTVRVRVKIGKAEGDGWLSKGVCYVVGGLVSKLMAEKAAALPVVTHVTELAGKRRELLVDLATIPAVQKLAAPLAFGKAPLDFVTVGKVEHREDGLLVRMGWGRAVAGLLGG